MRLKNIATSIMAISVLMIGGLTEAKTVKEIHCDVDGIMGLRVDSIDFRVDLTRLYGQIIGLPHTSNRIDSISLRHNGGELSSTDIDGVDMKRYFQWEDEGIIPIEIDFPPMKQFKNAKITTTGPNGSSVWTLSVK